MWLPICYNWTDLLISVSFIIESCWAISLLLEARFHNHVDGVLYIIRAVSLHCITYVQIFLAFLCSCLEETTTKCKDIVWMLNPSTKTLDHIPIFDHCSWCSSVSSWYEFLDVFLLSTVKSNISTVYRLGCCPCQQQRKNKVLGQDPQSRILQSWCDCYCEGEFQWKTRLPISFQYIAQNFLSETLCKHYAFTWEISDVTTCNLIICIKVLILGATFHSLNHPSYGS